MATRWLVESILAMGLVCLSAQGLTRRTFDMRYLYRHDRRGSKVTTFYRTEEQWFTQRLDHFQPANTLTWKQRYWMRDELHEQGGPVFLMIDGESEGSAMELSFGYWSQLAERYHALMFSLEHRFYGQSHPTRNMSVDNLKYLSSQQALADTAAFIEAMNREHKLPNGTKWIAFGGSYAGNLASWMRYKYSHLVYGAVASSAPILAKLDFTEFFKVVETSLSTYGSNCVSAVKDANHELQYLLESNSEQNNVTKKLGLCQPIDGTDKIEVATLFDLLSSAITQAIQYNDMVESSIKHVCDIMVNKTLGDPLDRYNATLKDQFEDTCKEFSYRTEIKHLNNITFRSNEENSSMDRQWTYQTCTEFGFYQTSETKRSLLGRNLPLALFMQMCMDLFGNKFTKDYIQKAVDHTNLIYGGLDIKATRVIYTHGSLDPWHALGLTQTVIPESPVIFINGSSHCADMLAEIDSDLPELKAARRRIGRIIGTWLG